jgi:malate dehydrogenase (oxaloacetate-decarboxylating)(NADP+)
MAITKEDALKYHSEGRPGKIEVVATKPCFTSRELSMAYTPGVADPCLEIEKDESLVYKYTAKGNLVAVVSNGTAVLGLGDIGPMAGKPVMEGKGVLFKRFADIDVFDIEVKSKDPKEIIETVEKLEPTFGGINLEDIKAPQCFEIEEELKKRMNIPVFHDDQHGTAIISCAALINAAEVAGKKLEDMRLVVVGAGAAGIACSKLYVTAGVKIENIAMFDSKGHIHKGRTDLNKYKAQFATDVKYDSLEDAMKGADAFLGLSKANLVSKDMVRSMNDTPVIFAMANPDPEITYEDATDARPDVIMATGRSDYPNQVNNVLGFPFIFRGALDVRAATINEEMKMAAVRALAGLAKEKVPDAVSRAYGGEHFTFGREYIIPKPFDPRVLWTVAPAVAKAAMDTGVARVQITDWEDYKEKLKERLGFSKEIIRLMIHKAQMTPKRVVYPEGEEETIIRAAHGVLQGKIARPILLGEKAVIENKIKKIGYNIEDFDICDPTNNENIEKFADYYYNLRQRKGVTYKKALKLVKTPYYCGSLMVQFGLADALVGGYRVNYPTTIKPALESVGMSKGTGIVAGMSIIVLDRKVLFFADTTVNVNPNAEQLADIAALAAETVTSFEIEPKVAMLSYSNFGSVRDEETMKVQKAVELIKAKKPDLKVDGEMQVDIALNAELAKEEFDFSGVKGDANILIFPNLASGNIAYKLMERAAGATVIGPILLGMKKSIHVLQRGATADDIINVTAIAVVDAESKK